MLLWPKKERLEYTKLLLEIVAIAIGGGWMIYLFIVEKYFFPGPPAITVKQTEEVIAHDDLVLVKSTIVLHNVGNRLAFVGAVLHRAEGIRISCTRPLLAAQFRERLIVAFTEEVEDPASVVSTNRDCEVVQRTPIAFKETATTDTSWWLKPDEEYSAVFEIYARRTDGWDAVRVVTDVWYSDGSWQEAENAKKSTASKWKTDEAAEVGPRSLVFAKYADALHNNATTIAPLWTVNSADDKGNPPIPERSSVREAFP